MIGKIVVGKSFKGCLGYCLNDKISMQNQKAIMKDRAEILMFNKCFGNERELVKQFNELMQLNTKLSKPVMHITLSLAPEENLGKDKLMEMSEHCAKEFGFENNQYIVISHSDTKHQHLHIIANRIGFDKRTVTDSNSYKKVSDYCRKMELKYDLKKVLNPVKYLSKEQRNVPRYDQRKERLKQHVKEALKSCYSFAQFEQKIKGSGYEIIKGRGISFADEKKVKFKGSEVGYSLQTIEGILEKQSVSHSLKVHESGSQNNREAMRQAVELIPKNKSDESRPNMLEELLKPAQMQDGIDHNLLPKKHEKKKHKSQHL